VLYETLIHGLGDSPLLLAGYAMGLLAVFFTGFYTFRMVFLTFHGEPRTDVAADPEPVRWNVKGPLVVLGVLAAVLGVINMVPVKKITGANIDFLHQFLDEGSGAFLTNVHHYTELLETGAFAGYEAADIGTGGLLASAAISFGLALAGVLVAYRLYNVPEPVEHTDKLGRAKTFLMHNYYQDEYQVWLATGLTLPAAKAADAFDQGIVDGVVNGISSVSRFSGRGLRRIQTGVVSNYAALLTLGLVLLIAVFGFTGGWF
jgi:NADH-quinone oxidoreductase subunit L